MALTMGTFGGCIVTQIFLVCNAGQNLENVRSSFVEKIDEWKIITFDSQSISNSKIMSKLTFLSKHLARPCPICPYNFIGINHTGFVQIVATIMTYIVVLMQFRASQNSSGC